MWAEMTVPGSHEGLDEHPPCPLFGAKRPRGRSSKLDTLTDVLVAGKIGKCFITTYCQAGLSQ